MNFLKNRSLLIPFLLLFFSPFSILYAQTEIYSNNSDGNFYISENTIWSKENSPYIIYENVVIEKGSTLSIDPGVVVKFEESRYLEVLGNLNVFGSSAESVFFTSLYDDSVEGDADGDGGDWLPEYSPWGGVECFSGSKCQISNTKFSYADFPIGAYLSDVSINSSDIKESKNTIFSYGSNLSIKDSSFFGISYNFIDALSSSTITIDNSNIREVYGVGVSISDNSNFSLSNSNMSDFYGRLIFEVFDNTVGTVDNLLLDNSVVDYVANIFNNSSFDFKDSLVSNSFVNKTIEVFGKSHLNIYNSTFINASEDTSIGFYDCDFGITPELKVENSIFDGGLGKGFEIFCNVRAQINKSKIKNFLKEGLLTFSDPEIKITDSEITYNETGIKSWGANIEVKDSIISDNLSYGISNNPEGESLPIIAVSNWWGDQSGPFNEISNATGTGNKVSSNVVFSPWLLTKPGGNTCCSNVVFIPGLQSSRLYKKGLFSVNQLWEPNRNADVEKLFLNSDGESLETGIYTKDIIKRTNIGMGIFDQNIYLNFFDMMDRFVTEGKINGWEALSYDWRFDINEIIEKGSVMEDNTILNFVDEVLENAGESKTGKVSLVAHSNGGLISKILIEKLKEMGKADLIDKLILIAVPQLGTPEAVSGILHGDGQEILDGWILGKVTARSLAENMMGAYNLLPSEGYFSSVSQSIIKFTDSIKDLEIGQKMIEKYGYTIDTARELEDFVLGLEGRSEPKNEDTNTPNVLKKNLLDISKNNRMILDNWTAPEGLEIVQLAGWGIKTISGVEYRAEEVCAVGFQFCVLTTILDRRPIFTEDGDGIVVSPSALAMKDGGIFYLDLKSLKKDGGISLEHKDILEATSTREFIMNSLFGGDLVGIEYIKEEKPQNTDSTLELSMHSPVSIEVFDEYGNHTGVMENPNPNSDFEVVEENVSGSRYLDFGEGKYIVLNEGGKYDVKLQGMDFGNFTLEIKTTSASGISTSSSFSDLPTTPSMKGDLVLDESSSIPKLLLDINGDNQIDTEIISGQKPDLVIQLRVLKEMVNSLDIPNKLKQAINKKIDNLIKLLEKDKKKTVTKKVEKFIKELPSKLEKIKVRDNKKDLKNNKYKKTTFSKTESQSVVEIINQLLDNSIK